MMLTSRIVQLFKHDNSLMTNVLTMLSKIKTNFEIVSNKNGEKITFYNQFGGIVKVFVDNVKYNYNIEYAKPLDKKNTTNEVYLLTVKDGSEGCGLILIDNQMRHANIQAVSDYSECLICDNPNIKYKVGAILMQIIIYECKKLKIKKITLEDNSKKYFTGFSIELMYYRTIAQGKPYYSKFGFKNSSPLIVRNNEQLWKTKPVLNKKKIIEIYKNFMPKSDNTINKLFNMILEDYDDSIYVSELVIKLFDKAVKQEKQIEKQKTKSDNLVNLYAKILYLILKKLYIVSGYELLPDNKFTLFL